MIHAQHEVIEYGAEGSKHARWPPWLLLLERRCSAVLAIDLVIWDSLHVF